jgi:hypothetical protein
MNTLKYINKGLTIMIEILLIVVAVFFSYFFIFDKTPLIKNKGKDSTSQ